MRNLTLPRRSQPRHDDNCNAVPEGRKVIRMQGKPCR
jgi:hypothetical protein